MTNIDELNDFRIVVDETLTVAAAAAAMDLSGAGLMMDREAWVSLEWLRSHVGHQDPSYWTRFKAMLSFAETKGWISPDASAVLGHIEHQRLPPTEE